MSHAASQPSPAVSARPATPVPLLGLGTARPAHSIRQDDAARLARQRCCTSEAEARWLQRVYAGCAVDQRGSVLLEDGESHATFYPLPQHASDAGPTVRQRMAKYAEHALPLARFAARQALAEAGITPEQVGQLVTVSCTGFTAPGLDIHLINALGLPATVGRSAIGFMGCHGAINGLRVAKALACERPGVPVLLCAAELCSLHFQYGFDRQHIVANALFADGAAACVLQADRQATAAAPPPSAGWRVIDTACQLIPDSQEAMTWNITEHGFRMTLSPGVPDLVQAHLHPWLTRWLAEHGLSVGDVARWAVHPGGPRVLDAVATALGLPGEALAVSRQVLAECGNMSSPTVLFIADRLRQVGGDSGGPCVMLAFGPGLIAEAALLGMG